MSEGKKYCPKCGYEMVEVTTGEPICTNCGYVGVGTPLKNPLEPTHDLPALLARCKVLLEESATNLERVSSIERGEEWTGGEPTLETCRVLGQIKEVSRHAQTLLADLAKAGVK